MAKFLSVNENIMASEVQFVERHSTSGGPGSASFPRVMNAIQRPIARCR